MASAGKRKAAGIVLGVETSTSLGGVALCGGGEIIAELTLANPRSHSEKLLPAIETLLASASRSMEELSGVAVSAGPEDREEPAAIGTLAFIFDPKEGDLVEGTIARLRASA